MKYKKLIYDTCDELSLGVWNTFRVFVMVCRPQTDDEYETLMFDSMEVWDCV